MRSLICPSAQTRAAVGLDSHSTRRLPQMFLIRCTTRTILDQGDRVPINRWIAMQFWVELLE
jgi:hypothetical protein